MAIHGQLRCHLLDWIKKRRYRDMLVIIDRKLKSKHYDLQQKHENKNPTWTRRQISTTRRRHPINLRIQSTYWEPSSHLHSAHGEGWDPTAKKVAIRQRGESWEFTGRPIRRTDFVALCVTPCISNKFRFCFPPNKGMNQFCKMFYFFFVFFSSKGKALRTIL